MERYRDREAAQIGGILGLLYITEHVGGVRDGVVLVLHIVRWLRSRAAEA